MKNNFRKILFVLFLISVILIILVIKNTSSKVSNIPYDDAQNLLRQTMQAYYLRGRYIQYNHPKAYWNGKNPEEATEQEYIYGVCSSYTYNIYKNAFGIDVPKYTSSIITAAKNYYILNKDVLESNDNNIRDTLAGKFLIYYNEIKGNRYSLAKNDEFLELVKVILPGDIFVINGHALIAYDVIYEKNNFGNMEPVDIVLLNATGNRYIRTNAKFYHSNDYLYYDMAQNNGFTEGSIQRINLSSKNTGNNSFLIWNETTNSWKINTNSEVSIIRPFYRDQNGNAVFNYDINESVYTNSSIRTKYPGLYIEKTVDKTDNNSVNFGDELTYTIKLDNKSNVLGNSKIYYDNDLYIEETLDDKVEYISCTKNCSIKGKKIIWKISKNYLNDGVEITYKVRVKENLNNINKIIVASGIYKINEKNSNFLSTGKVENKIVQKVNLSQKNTYKNCYNLKKNDYVGLELIDEIYKCVFDESDFNFSFSSFDFENVFRKIPKNTTGRNLAEIAIRTCDCVNNCSNNWNDCSICKNKDVCNYSEKVKSMILNNYWNAIIKALDKVSSVSSTGTFILPMFSLSKRAETINGNDFKDGDILIYSVVDKYIINERGIYAYIFLTDNNGKGKFVGINTQGGSTLWTRNEFTYNYYDSDSQTNQKYKDLYFSGNDNSNGISSISKISPLENLSEVLEFLNYQSLFDKNYYLILRPELLIKELVKIDIDKTTLSKTNYIINEEELDLKKVKLKIIYNNSEEIISLSDKDVKVTGFDNTKIGTKTIKVMYKSAETSFNVEIVDKKISSIELLKIPSKVIINKDSMHLIDGKLKIIYDDNSFTEVDLLDEYIKNYQLISENNYSITINYFDNELVFEKEVEKNVNSFNIKLIYISIILLCLFVFIFLNKKKNLQILKRGNM